LKRQPTEWEKTFAIRQGIDNENIQGAQKTKHSKINDPMKKLTKELKRAFSKKSKWLHEEILTVLTIKEMQITTTLRFFLTPGRIATIKNTTNNGCWRGGGKKEPSYTGVGMSASTTTMENSMESPQKTKSRAAI
jgi:hypothetical protein